MFGEWVEEETDCEGECSEFKRYREGIEDHVYCSSQERQEVGN